MKQVVDLVSGCGKMFYKEGQEGLTTTLKRLSNDYLN